LDDELAADQGLRLNQYEVLLRLNRAPDKSLRMSDLARMVLLSPSGITRTVDQLERRGFVERRVCPTDRRGFLAVLTPEGKARLRAATKVHVAGIRELFCSHLTPKELEGLAAALESIAPPEVSQAS
jgi:DNA-binding MarR family transcriptional regulator